MTAYLQAWKTGRVRTGAARLLALMLHPRATALLAMALALLALSGGLLAQQSRRRKPERRGPRALAVLEVGPNGRMNLVPVAILDSGKFYDAGLYRAVPRPMALE